jgi:hypothetical protein
MSHEIQVSEPRGLSAAVDEFARGLGEYLVWLGLPTEAVLVPTGERRAVINNMATVVSDLSDQQRQAAMYISKFVAACVAGLFDAALNYLWDETVRNLRSKVARFDLAYFFDSVITDPDRRSRFREEADLDKLDDWDLIRGCRDTGIISQVGHRHLDYIRDMRNHTSAAHPNQNELIGLQLAAWLQTCIREVLAKDPEGPAIEVRKLLRSLRQENLSTDDIPPIAAALVTLPEEISRSLLRASVGMFTDTQLSAETRSNIRLIAPHVWAVSSDEARYEAGLKQATFSVNGEISRARLAREFLELVEGLSYLPPVRLAVEINTALETLMTAHGGWDNFYTEVPHARFLQRLVPATGAIPENVLAKYVRVLALCRIGNGYGVSWEARPVYDELIGRWRDREISVFVDLSSNGDISSRLQFDKCSANFQILATRLLEQVTNIHIRRMLEFLAAFPPSRIDSVWRDSRYQELVRALPPRSG